MIQFKQIKSAEEIASLSDYCVLSIDAEDKNTEKTIIDSVSILRVSDCKVCSEAYLPIRHDAGEDTEFTYSLEEAASGLAKLFPGNVLAAEPSSVLLLRSILEEVNAEGEVLFLPVCRLAAALFPAAASVSPADAEHISEALSIPRPGVNEPLQAVYLEANLLENCRQVLSENRDPQKPCTLLVEAYRQDQRQGGKHSRTGKVMESVSDETLTRWAKSAWSASPWVIAALAIAAFILALILFPRSSTEAVDRNKPPVSYIVLSWDEAGKYGTMPSKGSTADHPVEFRIPYGVYRVQNNNSIPVELYILSEEDAGSAESSQEKGSAVALSSDQEPEDDGETSDGRVILRPNSDRQITIDEGQYLTLSEEAKDLILFYISEVPEEPESDTTGQVAHGQSIVYAYVKGTEVRFRRAPSLEGQIIDSLNNGQQVQVLAISGEWTHVQVQDQKGYIFSQYLTTEDPNQKHLDAKAEEETASGESASGTGQEADASGDTSSAAAQEAAPAETAGNAETAASVAAPASPEAADTDGLSPDSP